MALHLGGRMLESDSANADSSQATESKKRLALAIIDFLATSLKDGTVAPDDQESIEIAQSCIAESFKVDPSDPAKVKDALGGQSLAGIYGVYEKMRAKGASGSDTTSHATTEGSPTTPSSDGGPTEEQKAQAEAYKVQGNQAMGKKEYSAAIEAYSKALEIVPENPIYLSNRAAAYSASHQHARASADAHLAVTVDPTYTKAWSRLGLARYALGDAKGSMEAYQKGIDYEGNGGSDAMKRGLETATKKVEELAASATMENDDDGAQEGAAARGPAAGGPGGMPDLAGLASMLGGGGGNGGPGGAGGGPDLSSIMNNPMFAGMARNLMSNPQLMNNLMNNPQLRQMAENFGGGGRGAGGGVGGGTPDLSALMSDPTIAELYVDLSMSSVVLIDDPISPCSKNTG